MSKVGTSADGFLSRWLYSEPAPHGRHQPFWECGKFGY
jgi:hypothetical protein